jgi:hypothetical protein
VHRALQRHHRRRVEKDEPYAGSTPVEAERIKAVLDEGVVGQGAKEDVAVLSLQAHRLARLG